MELFTINRYDDSKSHSENGNEDDILSHLLKKVEKRKRKQKKFQNTEPEQLETEEKKGKLESFEVSKKYSKVEIDPIEVNSQNQTSEISKDVVENTENSTGFAILCEESDARKLQSVDVVLPSWLAHPTIVSSAILKTSETNVEKGCESNISQLSYLTSSTRSALKEMNISQLFPVQLALVPWVLESHSKPAPFRPRDVCVSAPTGSGKTLSFAIPVVQLLSQRVERKIRALVILPVVELAQQVFKIFKRLCAKTDLSVCLLSTLVPFHVEQNKLVEEYKGKYYSKADIIVTTPGRLVDHLHSTKGFYLNELQFLVIDEADRVMDAVYQNWLYHLDTHVRTTSDQLLSGKAAPLCYNELERLNGSQPHKLLFSATLSQDPEKLQSLRLFQPKLFTSVLDNLQEFRKKYAEKLSEGEVNATPRGDFIGKYTTPAELTEKICITEDRLKPLTLFCLIKGYEWKKFLCFTNSIESSGRLAFVLKELFEGELLVEELSASKTAKERTQILQSFSSGKINGLVCSDALARGIDIPDVDIVISYDAPRHIKAYIHRIGRTARAGRPGTAITLLTQKEQLVFDKTLAEVGKLITCELTADTTIEESYAPKYTLALNALHAKVVKDKRMSLVQKERAKEMSLVHKDTSAMTIMEKLQVQANALIHEKETTSNDIKIISRKFKRKGQKSKAK